LHFRNAFLAKVRGAPVHQVRVRVILHLGE
jgi:hypothetical protein